MILPSFIIHYLFYMLLIFFCFAITSGVDATSTDDPTDVTTIEEQTRITTTITSTHKTTSTTRSTHRTTSSTHTTTSTASSTHTTKSTTTLSKATTRNADPIHTKAVQITMASGKIANSSSKIVVISDSNRTNGTIRIHRPKSLLPIILGSAFGGLAIIVLATSVIIYVLIKQGYIKVFNQPRTRAKDTERSRTGDSSSSISGASPSRR